MGVLAIPVGVALAKYDGRISLLDAAWAIPVAALASVAALLEVRGTSGHVRFALEPARQVRLGRLLAVLGICIAVAAAIAVGFYYLLVQLEG